MGTVPAYKDISCASDESSEFRPGYEVGTGDDTHQTIEPVDPGPRGSSRYRRGHGRFFTKCRRFGHKMLI